MLCELNFVKTNDGQYYESVDDAADIISAYLESRPIVFYFKNNESNGSVPTDYGMDAPVYISLQIYFPARTVTEDETEQTIGPVFGIYDGYLYTDTYELGTNLGLSSVAQNGKLRIEVPSQS